MRRVGHCLSVARCLLRMKRFAFKKLSENSFGSWKMVVLAFDLSLSMTGGEPELDLMEPPLWIEVFGTAFELGNYQFVPVFMVVWG